MYLWLCRRLWTMDCFLVTAFWYVDRTLLGRNAKLHVHIQWTFLTAYLQCMILNRLRMILLLIPNIHVHVCIIRFSKRKYIKDVTPPPACISTKCTRINIHQGLIKPPKAARGHVTYVDGEIQHMLLKIDFWLAIKFCLMTCQPVLFKEKGYHGPFRPVVLNATKCQ